MSSSMLSQVIRTRESFSTLLAGKGLFTSMKRTEVTLQVFLATESAATVLAHKCFRRVINSSRLATSSINHDLFIKRKVSRARLIKMVVMMMMMMVVGRYSWRKKSMFQFDLLLRSWSFSMCKSSMERLAMRTEEIGEGEGVGMVFAAEIKSFWTMIGAMMMFWGC